MNRYSVAFACAALGLFGLGTVIVVQQLFFWVPDVAVGPGGETLAEALGYPREARLLVVNSDDTAGHPSFTDGVVEVMPLGMVTSTSIIVHDRNELELKRVARLAKGNPGWGIGVHLMLTNEYQDFYPWAPVLPRSQVPSLYNDAGLAWEKIAEVEVHANPSDVEKEFRAQIQRAFDAGIDVTHIDSHMGTYYRDSRYPGAKPNGLRQAAITVAAEFDLPMTMNTFDAASRSELAHLDDIGVLHPDSFFGFYELEDVNRGLGYESGTIGGWAIAKIANAIFGLEVPYLNQPSHETDLPLRLRLYLRALAGVTRPGLNHVFMHAAVEHGPSNATIPRGKNHEPGMDKVVRLGDTAVFSNPAVRRHMEDNELYLVNYADIRSVQRLWRVQRTPQS